MRIKFSLILVLTIIVCVFFSCTQADKGSFSGQVLRDGKPARGSVRVLDPKTMTPLAEATLSNSGKFFFKDIPTGEWLIALTTRTGGVIGNYHYVKVKGFANTRELIFDPQKEDPKAQKLLSEFSHPENESQEQPGE